MSVFSPSPERSNACQPKAGGDFVSLPHQAHQVHKSSPKKEDAVPGFLFCLAGRLKSSLGGIVLLHPSAGRRNHSPGLLILEATFQYNRLSSLFPRARVAGFYLPEVCLLSEKQMHPVVRYEVPKGSTAAAPGLRRGKRAPPGREREILVDGGACRGR